MDLSKTKHRIRINVCFRQLDRSVMKQSSSHPWNCIPFNRRYPAYLIFVIQDQVLRNIEQCSDLFEVYTLGCTQIFLVILSKTHCRLHSRRHEDSPDRRDSFKPFATGVPMPVLSESELCAPSVPGLDALEPSVGDRLADFAATRSSSTDLSSCCLFDMVLDLLICLKWLSKKTRDVEQTKTMIPLITGEIAHRQQICELALGVNKFDLDFWSK